MDLKQREVIESHRSQLNDDFQAATLLPHLPCLTQQDRDLIQHEITEANKNQLLLHILQRRDGAWDQLIQALKKQNQGYLATSLVNAVCKAESTINSFFRHHVQKLEELKQRLIKFYLNHYSFCQSLFPGATENVARLYVSGCWLDLTGVLQESSIQPNVSKEIKDFYNGNSTTFKEKSCPRFSNYKDILQIMQARNTQYALVAGDAGVGKTTFLKKLCCDWADQARNPETKVQDQSLSKYTFVFAIPLRNVKEDASLPELALRFLDKYKVCDYDEELLKVIEAYCENNCDTTLFLLDGLDEYKWKQSSEKRVKCLTLEKILDENEAYLEAGIPLPGTLIVTTRPNAAKHAKLQMQIMHFKLLGLNEHSAHNYVERFFGLWNKTEYIPLVLTALKRHPHLGTTPLLLMLTCYLVHSKTAVPTGHRKEVYDKVCLMLFQRAKIIGRIKANNFEDWKELEIARQLMQLAFNGLLNRKLTFSLTDLKQTNVDQIQACETGLLREDYFFPLHLNAATPEVELSFPHYSIQEYFAAQYVSMLTKDKCLKNNEILENFYKTVNIGPFLYAVKHDLVDCMKTLISQFNKAEFRQAISEAVKNSSNYCLEWFIKNGYPINTDNKTEAPIILAATHGHLDTVQLLLNSGAKIDIVNKDDETALIRASSNGHTETVKLLLDRGANVQMAKYNGDTALISACSNGHTETVKLLLERGAKVDKIKEYGETALIRASSNGHTETVKMLLDRGAAINKVKCNGDTALIKASSNGHIEVVKVLLDRGAVVDIANKDDETALIGASRKAYTEIVELLLNEGANVNKTKWYGETALMAAAWNGHTETAKLLLDRGAEIDKMEWCGETALIRASCNGHTKTVKLLLKQGAKVDIANKDGETALIRASWNGHNEIAKLLLDRGSVVDKKNWCGETALTGAACNGHNETVKLLLSRGAKVDNAKWNDKIPLFGALSTDHTERVKPLLEQEVEVENAYTIVPCNSWTQMETLGLEQKAKVEMVKKDGETALIRVSWNSHTKSIKLIMGQAWRMNRGSVVNIISWYGEVTCIETLQNGYSMKVKLILKRNVKIEKANNGNETADFKVSWSGHTGPATLVVQRGS